MTPDPAAVRSALENIDADMRLYGRNVIRWDSIADTIVANSDEIIAAARAWLEQQEGNE